MKLTGICKYIKSYKGWYIFYVQSGNNINKYFDKLEHINNLNTPILYNSRLDRLFKVKHKYCSGSDLTLNELYYLSITPRKYLYFKNKKILSGVLLEIKNIEKINLQLLDNENKKALYYI